MRYLPIILFFLAGTAAAETVFVCRGADERQPACVNNCVVQAWDKANGACTEAIDTSTGAFRSYRDRQPTAAMLDDDLESSVTRDDRFRTLLKVIADLHGTTPRALLDLMRTER